MSAELSSPPVEESPAVKRCASVRRRVRRTLFFLLVVGLLIAWGADHQPADATKPVAWHVPKTVEPGAANVLRIASFNIHSGKGTDRNYDLARVAADLKDIDVAGLYEVRDLLLDDDQAAEIGDRTQMRSAFLPTEHRWWRDHFGNAVLTKVSIEFAQRIPLFGTRGKAFRQAVLFDVKLQDRPIHVVMTHVDSSRDRLPQLAAVIHLFESLAAPAILMGDLNSRPDDPRLQELLSHPGVSNVLAQKLGDAAPTDNIDWIITRGLECVDASYHHSGASDHPVIKATLRLPAE